jgi:hypothetical protein
MTVPPGPMGAAGPAGMDGLPSLFAHVFGTGFAHHAFSAVTIGKSSLATECLGFARPVKKVTDETPVVLARHAWVMSADSRGATTWRGPERPR